MKFLYLKKATLNRKLYQTHLMLANEWVKGLYLIAESIIDTLNYEMQNKYEILDEKLKKNSKIHKKQRTT